jgi:hypothetical protein
VGNKTKYHVKKRLFLNRDYNMTAFAVGVVEDTSEVANENDSHWRWGKIELMLADCSRKVCFDFSMSDAEDRANSLFKIRRLAEVVNAVKEALETEATSISKRKIPKKKEENKG